MKTWTKVFTIIGMVIGAIGIIPLVVGLIALKKMKEAKEAKDLTGIAICNLLFCSLIGGIFMLCLKDSDLNN